MQNSKGTDKMNGIFAYTGKDNAKEIILSGLQKLSARGSDMSGIVLREEESFVSLKIKGSPAQLTEKANSLESNSKTGIGECTFERRFKASSVIAPPSSNNLFAVAVDGDIENFKDLKQWSREPFSIAGDEDLLLACLCIMEENNKVNLAQDIFEKLEGAPSFAFVSNEENAVYCQSGKTKLIVGSSGSGAFVSSELEALIPFCDKYAVLESGEIAKLTKDRIFVFDNKLRRIKKIFHPINEQSRSYSDFLSSDELYSSSVAVKNTFCRFVKNGEINFDYLKLNQRYLDKIDKIILLGGASEKRTAMLSKSLFETYCFINASSFEADEFLSSKTPVDKNTLVIAVSERGEDADILDCIRKAAAFKAKTIALTANRNSALARESDFLISTNALVEGNRRTLSGFISDYTALCLFAFYVGEKIGIISKLYTGVAVKMTEMLSGILSSAIKDSNNLENAAFSLAGSENIFIAGTGNDCFLSAEAAAKIRELTVKNANSLSLGELCDYPEELISSGAVFALICDSENLNSSIKRLRRLKNSDAKIVVITCDSAANELEEFENVISFNDSLPALNPISCIAVIYKIALLADNINKKGNVDKSA